MANNLGIWLAKITLAILVLILQFRLASTKTLVKPPWLPVPNRPKPSSNKLLHIASTNNLTTPTCTTVDGRIDEPNMNPNSSSVAVRNGVTSQRLKWTNFYVLPDSTFEQWELDVVNNAMWNLWQVVPCVNFGIYPSSSTPSGDYMKLIKGRNNGCNSHVGRQGGRQDINLQIPGCMNVGTVMHELIHALGFYHEHCRHDRDDYIWVYWENMQPVHQCHYHIFADVQYNYNSIMHYDSWAFSKNGMGTMMAKNEQAVGSTGVLQETDIQRLKAMYEC